MWWWLVACSGPDGAELQHLARASMAVRGVRPTIAEIESFEGGTPLASLVREWFDDPRFGETIRDLHAESLLVRIDAQPHLPAVGGLAGLDAGQIAESLDEEPLRLIERIVLEGRPYSEIVMSDTTVTDVVSSAAHGAPFDPAGEPWQEVAWTDDRPAAGILSSTTLWQRHMSSDSNHHRTRAAWVRSALLCEPLPPSATVVDPSSAEDAVATDPGCTGCHALLDPVASAFFGFQRYVLPSEATEAWLDGCPPETAAFCPPIAMWDPAQLADREATGLPEASLDGQPVSSLDALGVAIALDPRFARCAARRFRGWFTRTPWSDVPEPEVERLTEVFRAHDLDARELIVAIVTSPEFLDGPPQTIRPESLARTVEDLTGFAWGGDPTDPNQGPVRFATTDAYGFRTLLGGMDSWNTITPDPRALPTRELALEWLATEAADVAVGEGRLPIGGVVDDPDAVRDALTDLHLRVWTERASEASLDRSVALFDGAFGRSGDAETAWKVVVTAFLLDHRVVTW